MNNIGIFIKNDQNEFVAVDLFDDETIVMNSSIQDVKDITKTFTDFTQTFKVPASDTNNKLFKHWYNKNIFNGYDGRTRSDSYIEINLATWKNGNIQLDGVDMKNGKPHSYRLTFFGLLVNLKNKFKDDYISELDFESLNYTHDFDTVQFGLNNLINGSLIYSLFSSDDQWYYDSNSTAVSGSENTKNIHYEAGTEKGIKWSKFKPSMKITAIIDAIEAKYDITFSDDFITSGPLDNLYMWLSREKGSADAAGLGIDTLIDWDSGSLEGYMNLATDIWTALVFTGDGKIYWDWEVTITPDAGYTTGTYNFSIKDSASNLNIVYESLDNIGTKTFSGTIYSPLGGAYYYENGFYVNAPEGFNFSAHVRIRKNGINAPFPGNPNPTPVIGAWDSSYSSTNVLTGEAALNKFLPKMKVIEFINGIIKMFNLVAIPTSATEIYLDKLDTWYSSGSALDISDTIRGAVSTINRVDIPSFIDYTFKETDTINADRYRITNNVSYGDLEFTAVDIEDQTKIYGKNLEIELPFEQIMYDRLHDGVEGPLIDIQYAAVIDADLKPLLPKPHLYYAVKQQCSGSTFALLSDADFPTEMSSSYMPFHADVPSSAISSYSTLWGADRNEWDGSVIPNSLFSENWAEYVGDLFHVSRRLFKHTATLSQGQLLTLSDQVQYNKVTIHDTGYLINSMKTNLKTGVVKFELLNNIVRPPEPVPPADVTGVTTDNNGNLGPITVNWVSVLGAVNYEISRNVNGGIYNILTSVATGTSYVDHSAQDLTDYCYKMKAISTNGLLSVNFSNISCNSFDD